MKKGITQRICCITFAFLFSCHLWAQDSSWSVNIHDYQYDMSVYAQLNQGDDLSLYEVAAFVNNECRGIAVIQEKDGDKWLHLRIRSNSSEGENITFRIYDKSSKNTISAKNEILFTSQGLMGSPSSPIKILTQPFVVGDVTGDGCVNGADIVSLVNYVLGSRATGFVTEAADVNNDGNVNGADCVTLINMILNKNE